MSEIDRETGRAAAPRESPSDVGALLRRRAAERGDDLGYLFLDDGEREGARLTWGELDRRARAIGGALQAGGLGGGRALLLYPPGLDFVAAFFGCLYAGVGAVPAYPPRSARSLPRLAAVALDARAAVALTDAASRERFAGLAAAATAAAPALGKVRWLSTDDLPAGAEDGWSDPGLGGGDLAFLQYTSGSTSAPKGVEVSHGNLLHNEELIRRAFGQSAESVVVGWLPLYHDMGLIGTVLQPLYSGSRCVLMSPLAFLQKPWRWLAAISRYRGTTSGGPNFAYELCVRKVGEAERAGLDLASWEVAFNGAEPVRADTLDRFAETFAPCGFRREAFLPCYGLAEATLFVSGGGLTTTAFDPAALARGRAVEVVGGEESEGRRLVACGRPPDEQRVVVAEPEERRPLAPGEVGEIWIAGPSVAGGYWRRPEATAETFAAELAAPLADGLRGPFLRTGDLGFLARGRLYVTGRIKDLIIIRGRNHYPQDVELTVEAAHPALRPGCGAAFAVEAGGEERLAVVQEVEREAARGLDGPAVVEAIRRAVAEEHQLDAWGVALLAPGQVPKTSSGKVRRHACKEAFAGGGFQELYRDVAGDLGGVSKEEKSGVGEEAGDSGAAVAASADDGSDVPTATRPVAASAIELVPAATDSSAVPTATPPVREHRRQAAKPPSEEPPSFSLQAEVARALRVPPDSVTPDRVVALDSLAAIELRGRVEAALGVELPLGELLAAPTFAELSAWATGEGAAGARGPAVPVPVAAGPPPAEFPLSHGQRALWFLHRLVPASAAYHVAVAARLPEGVDLGALARALARLVARHPALRTVFAAGDDGPVQRVLDDGGLGVGELTRVDAAGLGDGDLARRLGAEAARPFDLAAAPPLRLALFDRGGDGRVLLLAVHHLAVDLWSLVVAAEELGALYAAETGAVSAAVPPAPALTYADFVRWQGELLASPAGEAMWTWWRERLAAPLPVLDLPTDRPRPPVLGAAGGAVPFRLDGAAADRLRALAAGAGVTLFVPLLAGFQALLRRWGGGDDLVVGTPAAGRSRPELAGLIGYLVNPLPLRVDLGGDPAFSDLVGRVREVSVGALERQDFPFPLLVERLAPARDPGRSPLFQAFFALARPHRLSGEALAGFVLGEAGSRVDLGGGLVLDSVAIERRTAQFDLELVVVEGDRSLAGSLRYAADLFDAATARRMAGQLAALLSTAAAEPGRRLSELPLLAAAERHQLLAEWNDAARGWDLAPPVHRRIAARAAATPDRVAVAGGGEALTYGELAAQAGRLAAELRRRGVGAETRVAIALERSPRLLVALLGVLEAGAAYVPLDPAYPRERLALMLADSGAALVVTEGAVEEVLVGDAAGGEAPAEGGPPAVLRLDLLEATPPPAGPLPGPVAVPASAAAYVIYTSGSTGRPKGVVVPHGALVNFLAAMAEAPGLGEDDVLVAVTSLSFDISTLELFGPLVAGGRVELAGRDEAADPRRLAARLAASGATRMQATPATWRALVDAGWRGSAGLAILCGGEALPAALAGELARRGDELWNLYGPTETTVWSARRRLAGSDALPGAFATGGAPLGRPIADTTLHLLDRGFRPVPIGAEGELWIGGVGVARGYHRRPGLTADRFRPDPFAAEPGARLYRTGDLVRRRADGDLDFRGRVDHQVKVRGHRIEPGEVEAALATHPAVGQAVVVAGDDRLTAFFTPRDDGPPPAAAELRGHLAERLPGHLVPALFVPLAELPRTPNGKVDRGSLIRRGALLARAESPEAGDGAPLAGLEAAIAEVWCEVLGRERVGPGDNFFDLGGHSLSAVRVHALLVERLGLDLTLVDLFRHPTVGALARRAGGGRGGEAVGRGRLRAARRRGSAADADDGAVAIVGLAGRFPGAADADELWRNLRAGVAAIRDLSDEELQAAGVPAAVSTSPGYVRAAAVLDAADRFDAGYFDLNPREAELLDPQHRLFLETAVAALEDAGCDPARFPGAIGVFGGAGMNGYLLGLVDGDDPAADVADAYQLMIGNDKDFLATRVAYKLDLSGPAVSVQTACSTSLVAVHLACRSLLAGECDAALAGGVSVAVPQAGYRYQEGMILSPDGRCRPFDAAARGTVRGSGVGVVVLRRLADALAAGDPIRAVVRGSAINNDGARKVGYTAPSVERQAEVIAEALAVAGVEPASISYLEAHGTGTELGDPIEVAALTEAFGGGGNGAGPVPGSVALGAIKASIGHLDAAAGVAGLIKTVLALEHREIPPTVDFRTPNPEIDFGPFRVADRLLPWPADGGPRRAGVSSFGIGGTNCHVVVEEAPPAARAAREPSAEPRPWQLLVLSARGEAPLERAAERLAGHLVSHPEADLGDVAWTLAAGRRRLEHRRAVVCRGTDDAAVALGDPRRVLAGVARDGDRPVAFLFPGQGAQHPGMGRGLYAVEPTFRREIDRAAEVLSPLLGLDLRAVLFPPVEDDGDAAAAADASRRLAETRLAQPALFAVEHALARLWMGWGVTPAAMLGHSLGEYVAACLAGVFGVEDALALVAARGRLMQEMPPGAMLAVALAAEEVTPLLAAAGGASGVVAVAAVNAPGSSVVSGPAEEIAALARRLDEQGVVSRRLATSHAFHSAMMEGAVAPFLAELARVPLSPPRIPFVSNLTGTWIRPEEATDPAYWARHLRQPVRFADGVATLAGDPRRLLLEVGPGQTLAPLVRRHPARRGEQPVVVSLGPPSGDEPERMLTALGRLWLVGAPVDWEGFQGDRPRRKVSLPTYPFERRRYWAERRRVGAGASGREAGDAGARRPVAGRGSPEEWFYLPQWRVARPALRPEVPAVAPKEEGAPAVADAGPATTAAEAAPWLILTDGGAAEGGLGDNLAARLAAGGRRAVVVRPGERFARLGPRRYAVDPRRRDDFARLLAETGPPAVALYLWGLQEPGRENGQGVASDRHGAADPLATLAPGFFGLVHLAQALAAAPGREAGADSGSAARIEVVVVADGMVDVGGDDPLRPESAALLGPCRVVPQEHPRLSCRAIDPGAPPPAGPRRRRLAARLLAEVEAGLAGSAPRTVAFRGERRWLPELAPLPVPSTVSPRLVEGARSAPEGPNPPTNVGATGPPPPLRPGGVYLIAGGFGGVGRALARRLAAEAGARLVLVGRTPLPAHGHEAAVVADPGAPAPSDVLLDPGAAARLRFVAELEAAGAEVLTVTADVADEAAMAAAVVAARERFGVLHGVVHAAGVAGRAAARPFAEVSPADVAGHFAAKLAAAEVLERVLAGVDLDFCVLVSSLSVELGGLGYAAYAAANLAMDAFVLRHNRTHPVPWLAVDWEGWRPEGAGDGTGGGADAAAAGILELALTPEEGSAAFLRALALAASGAAAGRLVIATGDLVGRLARWVGPQADGERPGDAGRAAAGQSGGAGEPAAAHPRPDLQNPYVEPAGEVERGLAEVWQQLLGIDRVGRHDNFFELGGTSLLGVRVVAELNRRFGVEVPTVGLFAGPTVESLAAVVAARRSAAAGDGAETDAAAGDGGSARGELRRAAAARRREARRPPVPGGGSGVAGAAGAAGGER